MLVDEYEKENRRDICQKCEHKSKDFTLFGITIFKRVKQCKICKCFLEPKTKIEFAKCPKDKWEK